MSRPLISQARQSIAAGWTEDRVATLKKLYAEGLSASNIAKALGGVTRNAVMGKAHRLRLEGRAKASPPGATDPARRPHRPTGKPRGPVPMAALYRAPPAGDEPLARPVRANAFHALPGSVPRPWTSRLAGECRWPIDPVTPGDEMLSCCAATDERYCAAHARMGGFSARTKAQLAGDQARRAKGLKRVAKARCAA